MRSKGKVPFSFGVAVMFTVLVVATQIAGSGPAIAYETHLGAPLYGTSSYSYARGHAEYEGCCGGRRFEVHLWNMSPLQGSTVVVFAGGHKIGSMQVRSDGRCYLHRDSRRGQTVPTLVAGNTVSVRTSGGTVVASGTFHRMMM